MDSLPSGFTRASNSERSEEEFEAVVENHTSGGVGYKKSAPPNDSSAGFNPYAQLKALNNPDAPPVTDHKVTKNPFKLMGKAIKKMCKVLKEVFTEPASPPPKANVFTEYTQNLRTLSDNELKAKFAEAKDPMEKSSIRNELNARAIGEGFARRGLQSFLDREINPLIEQTEKLDVRANRAYDENRFKDAKDGFNQQLEIMQQIANKIQTKIDELKKDLKGPDPVMDKTINSLQHQLENCNRQMEIPKENIRNLITKLGVGG